MKQAKEEELVGDDWEYAPMFNMRFHATERKMDMVRRRRLHRKMVATTEEAASIFSLKRAVCTVYLYHIYQCSKVGLNEQDVRDRDKEK